MSDTPSSSSPFLQPPGEVPAAPERPAPVEEPPPVVRLDPYPLAPVEDAPVDGSSALFEWSALRGAQAYRVQVAADAEFEEMRCATDPVTTTLLTLYDLLPEDGATFYWRVQARTAAGWQPWSAAARFTADTHQKAEAYRAAEAARVEAAQAAVGEAEAQPPYLVERTSARAVVAFFALMIVSFVVLLAYQVYLVDEMHSAQTPPAIQQTEAQPINLEETPPADAEALQIPE